MARSDSDRPPSPSRRVTASSLGKHLHRRDKGEWYETAKDLEKQFVPTLAMEEFSMARLTFDDSELMPVLRPALRIVRLESCAALTPASLINLGTCPNLAAINLEETTGVTDDVVAAIAAGCSHLKVLKLGGCGKVTDGGLTHLNEVPGNPSKTLIRLDVSRCVHVTGATFEALPESLEELDISGCREMTDPMLKKVIQQCPKLHALHMRRCKLITDTGLKHITESRNASKFQQLSIAGLELTERATGQIGDRLPKLKVLDVAGTHGISDGTVSKIARNCKDLEKFDLTASVQISDLSLAHLGNAARALRHLSLAGCIKLTNECTEHLYQGLPRLNFLNLQGCPGIEPESVQRLAKVRPMVQICGERPVQMKFHWTEFLKKKEDPDGGKKKGKKKKKKKKK